MIVFYIVEGNLIILEFMSLVGMIEKVVVWLKELCFELDVDVLIYIVYCLEWVLFG